MSTGFATLASAGRSVRERARASPRRAPGSSRPGRLAGVGAEDAEPAGVREHGDAAPARERLRREQRRDVEQLLERVGADDAGLVEERVDGRVGAGERRCVRARRPARPRGVRPLFIARIGLLARHAPRDARELARVAERLEVEQDELGPRVVLPPLEQVVRGDVGLVADRDEGGEAEAARAGLLEQRQPERAALGREADVAARARRGANVAFSRGAGDRDAEAVRPDQPRAVRAHEREQPLLALGALGADLGEAGRDDAERAHARCERRLGRVEHERRRERR